MLKRLKETWAMLSRSIYVGERLQNNIKALTAVSIFTALLGFALMILDVITGQTDMLIAAAATFLGGASCAYCAGALKRRDIAIVIPTVFCALAFTAYTVTGAAEGTAMLWSLFVPIGLGYFVSVKYGILLSAYYSLLFVIVFHTPLRSHFEAYYSHAFILRFPILYNSMAAFTAIALIHYHKSVLLEMDYSERLSEEVEKQTRVARERADRLEIMGSEMVQALAVTIDAKDCYTNGHSFRVSWYSCALARALGWPEQEVLELEHEALLHDIGKIGVPDSVLNKPGRLTDEEFTVIQSHTQVGGRILDRSQTLHGAAEVARCHHERFDGRGYPSGLAGEQIPLHARVVAISDAYDAMRSDRIYRKGLPRERIREELVKGRGTQFDPALLDVFLRLFDSGALEEYANRETFALHASDQPT